MRYQRCPAASVASAIQEVAGPYGRTRLAPQRVDSGAGRGCPSCLLIGAGLMLRSVMRLQAVDAGIRTDSVVSMRVALNFSRYTSPALRAQFSTELIDRCLRNLVA